MSETDETLEQITPTLADVMKALDRIAKKLDAHDAQFEAVNNQLEVVRQGIVSNSARFDQLEALAHEAKSIALMTRSQLTILTEEVRQSNKILA